MREVAVAVRERPILFQGAMVRALLAGTKSQTRRAVKLPEVICPRGHWEASRIGGEGLTTAHGEVIPEQGCVWHTGTGKTLTSPYGQPGDRLWVRESHWWFKDEHDPVTGYFPPKLTIEDVEYRADGEKPGRFWRPSIHMPRWASRLLLEVTEIRVQRLQEISEEDCWAEGIEETDGLFTNSQHIEMARRIGCCIDDAKPSYALLWEQINGAGSWALNPWVWAVSFRRVATT